jgi:FkbM family methyltransferase
MSDHQCVDPKQGLHQSQHGEDRWLDRYFCGKRDGFYVDVGAYDGIVISNSYYFEQIGWTGVLVEPNPTKAALCRKNRPHSLVFECAAVSSPATTEVELHDVPGGEVYSSMVASFNAERLKTYGLSSRRISVPGRTLDTILEEVNPPQIDFVSIDVEGAEIEVLKGFDIKRWRPRLVIVESPPVRSAEIRDYFTNGGYMFLRSININDIYWLVPATLPLARNPRVVAALDGVWYDANRKLLLPANRAVTKVRAKVGLRTRLKRLGLWT